MTKVMKLNVKFYGNYGGGVNETVLLPLDINGVLFKPLEDKVYEDEIYLGEIEGKHSECYGDLSVELVDLDKLTIKQVTDLIEQSAFGEFETYFEGTEEDYMDEDDYNEEKVNQISKSYAIQPKRWSIKTGLIHENFIKQIKDKYVKKFKTITVLEENYDNAMSVLHNSEIETF
jgi:hypothetical protein